MALPYARLVLEERNVRLRKTESDLAKARTREFNIMNGFLANGNDPMSEAQLSKAERQLRISAVPSRFNTRIKQQIELACERADVCMNLVSAAGLVAPRLNWTRYCHTVSAGMIAAHLSAGIQ